MADININDGTTHRLKEGQIEISGATDQYIILQRVYGTLRIVEGGNELIPISDGANLDPANIRQGDQRPTTVELQVRLAAGSLTGTADLRDLVEQTFTNGLAVPFEMIIEIPNSPGATSGTRITLAECVLDTGGLTIEEADGADTDKISMRITDYEPKPTYAAYTP